MLIKRTCAFTGHREITDKIDEDSLLEFVQSFIDEGFDTFLCGMAMGFDLIAADVVLKLKKKNPQIKLIACVPCRGQEKYFPPEEKLKYQRIIKECDEVKILSEKYYKGCMHVRDRYMVDNCSVLIGYGRKSEGGTHYTLTYAAGKGKQIYIV